MMITPTPIKRAIFFITFDILFSLVTLYLSYNLRFNFSIDEKYLKNFFWVFITLVSLKIIFIAMYKIYNVAWRFMSLLEAKKIFFAHLLIVLPSIYFHSASKI